MAQIKLIIIFAISLLVCSCAYTNEIAKYPTDWPPTIVQDCNSIEGQYLNKPIKWTLHPLRVKSDFAFALYDLFGGNPSDDVESFKLSISNSEIFKIDFIDSNNAVTKEVSFIKSEDYKCTDTGLSLSKSYYSKGGDTPRGPKTNIAHFTKTEDGNLAIHIEEHFKGFIYFIPAIIHESQWVLFQSKQLNK